jgi:hypothetical protein
LVIEKHQDAFIKVCLALKTIRDKRLWREQYKSFKAYCKERWGTSRGRIYQLAQAGDVIENLSTFVDRLPGSESQTRALVPLAPDEQRLVWAVVSQTTDQAPTAKHVRAVIQVLRELTVTKAIDDGRGEQIHIADALRHAITEESYERAQRQAQYLASRAQTRFSVVIRAKDQGEWLCIQQTAKTHGWFFKAYAPSPDLEIKGE